MHTIRVWLQLGTSPSQLIYCCQLVWTVKSRCVTDVYCVCACVRVCVCVLSYCFIYIACFYHCSFGKYTMREDASEHTLVYKVNYFKSYMFCA